MDPFWLFSKMPKNAIGHKKSTGQGKQRNSSTTLNDVRKRFVFFLFVFTQCYCAILAFQHGLFRTT